MLDTEENPKRDRYLHERYQRHGQHAHARLLVHLALLECDTLTRCTTSLSPAALYAVCPHLVELLLELNKVQLVRSLRCDSCDRGRVTELLDRERACDGAETDSRQDSNVPGSPSASTYRPSSPASRVHRVPEPAPPAWEQPDVISPVIHVPVSTRNPRITTSHIDASPDISTTNRLERPSPPPTTIIPETLPVPPL